MHRRARLGRPRLNFPSAPTRVLESRRTTARSTRSGPALRRALLPFQSVSAANSAESLDIARAMLAGVPTTAHYKLVAANAAFIYSKLEPLPLPEAL